MSIDPHLVIAACRASSTNMLLYGDSLRVSVLCAAALADPPGRIQHISPAMSPQDIAGLAPAAVVVVVSAETIPIPSAASIIQQYPDAQLIVCASDPAEVPRVLWDQCAVAIPAHYQLDPSLVRQASHQDHLLPAALPAVTATPLLADAVTAAVHQLHAGGLGNVALVCAALAAGRYVATDLPEFLNTYVLAPRQQPTAQPVAEDTPPQSPAEPDAPADADDAGAAAEPDQAANPPQQEESTSQSPDVGAELPTESAEPMQPPEPLAEEETPSAPLPEIPRHGRTLQQQGGSGGRTGNVQVGTRGRPRHPRRLRQQQELLHLPATLTAAAPWQRVRHAQQPQATQQVLLSTDDLRTVDRLAPAGELVVIIVDASGSMARTALRKARATAVALLEQSYRTRSEVAIIVAQGSAAFVGLPPTRSLKRAQECLAGLPATGGTPLASARLLAAQLARQQQQRATRVLELSDGRANVPLAGLPQQRSELRQARAQARVDAQAAAAQLQQVVQDFQIIPIGNKRRR